MNRERRERVPRALLKAVGLRPDPDSHDYCGVRILNLGFFDPPFRGVPTCATAFVYYHLECLRLRGQECTRGWFPIGYLARRRRRTSCPNGHQENDSCTNPYPSMHISLD